MRVYAIITLILIAITSNSQSSLIVAAGYSTNINRKPGSDARFTHIPISLQWLPGNFNKVFFSPFLKIDYLIPISNNPTSDYAYTANPALPAEITVRKSIRPVVFNINAGMRFRIYKSNKNSFYGDASLTAISHQNIKVAYDNYDTDNYEILNPDVDLRKTSMAVCIGFAYSYHFSDKSSLFFMLHLQSPPFVSPNVNHYKLSYRFVIPLQLTIGYGFSYKKSGK